MVRVAPGGVEPTVPVPELARKAGTEVTVHPRPARAIERRCSSPLPGRCRPFYPGVAGRAEAVTGVPALCGAAPQAAEVVARPRACGKSLGDALDGSSLLDQGQHLGEPGKRVTAPLGHVFRIRFAPLSEDAAGVYTGTDVLALFMTLDDVAVRAEELVLIRALCDAANQHTGVGGDLTPFGVTATVHVVDLKG